MNTIPKTPVLSSHVLDHLGERIIVSGWVHRIRELGALTFIVLRDGAGLLQIVHEKQHGEIVQLSPETVVQVEGTVSAEPRAPSGIELRDPTIRVVGIADRAMPVILGVPRLDVHLNTLLDHRVLTLRHPEVRRIFRVQNALVQGFRTALTYHDFVEVHTPKLIAVASESGASVFPVEYFGQTANLAQSPQLYKQIMVGVFGRVYEVGPVFRAEPHATTRHLSEYVSLDAEMGFIQDHYTVMALLREVLAAMLDLAKGEASADQMRQWPEVPSVIPMVHFSEALQLAMDGLGEELSNEPDLAPAHEAWLGRWALEQFQSDFLFVEGYPMATRPFYTHPDLARPIYSCSFDLLFRGQEIVTGGQRLHRHADYQDALTERGLSADGLEPYLNSFRFGMPPHGGFAIGLERLTARLLGLSNVREASLFPRDRTRLSP